MNKQQQIADLIGLLCQEHFPDPNNPPTSEQLQKILIHNKKFTQLAHGFELCSKEDVIKVEEDKGVVLYVTDMYHELDEKYSQWWNSVNEEERKLAVLVATKMLEEFAGDDPGVFSFTEDLMYSCPRLFVDLGYMGLHVTENMQELKEETERYKNEKLEDEELEEDDEYFDYTRKNKRRIVLGENYKDPDNKIQWMELFYPEVMDFIAWTMDEDGELYVDREVKEEVLKGIK